MDKQEFFLLIPAIIYGVAIVELMKIFDHKKNYIEMVGWGIFTMLAVIFTWIELYKKLDLITESNFTFFMIIGQAVLLARLARIITPEKEHDDTKKYFFDVRKSYFWLLIITLGVMVLMQYMVYDDSTPNWFRPILAIFFLICAYSKLFWLRISILILALGLGLARIFTDVIV